MHLFVLPSTPPKVGKNPSSVCGGKLASYDLEKVTCLRCLQTYLSILTAILRDNDTAALQILHSKVSLRIEDLLL